MPDERDRSIPLEPNPGPSERETLIDRLGFPFAFPFNGLGRTEDLMSSVTFNRDRQATWHGLTLLRADATIREVHYLKQGAPDLEVRLLVVNEMMPGMPDDCIEPLDYGVDRNGGARHKLLVVDVTPEQWEGIRLNRISLPPGLVGRRLDHLHEMPFVNPPQRLWWEQACSDHAILGLLRVNNAAPCHQLHYLQMVSEKLAKAHSWSGGQPPAKSHRGFVSFLRAIRNRSRSDRLRIASLLGSRGIKQFDSDIDRVLPLAHALQQLAPALAGDHGPNPEYPWPTAWPTHAPASHRFDVWDQLNDTADGRSLLRLIDHAVPTFPQYG